MVSLLTDTPAFFGDLCDEIRLFWDIRKIPMLQEISTNGFCVRHIFLSEENAFLHTCILYKDGVGKNRYTYRTRAVAESELLEYKKIKKRGAKIAVYRCLCAYFDIRKPWGSLTGVRPTKLLRESIGALGTEEARRLFLQEFDVSEEKFRLALNICRNQQAILESASEKDLDIYIGIPFCTSRCSYCSFFSSAITKSGRQEQAYVRALEGEITALADILGKHRVRCVYVGGGTPTALSPELLRRVLYAIQPFAQGEFTVEAGRPDTITQEKLALIREAGARRISINPQTTHAPTLRAIGRNHTVEDFFNAVQLARRMGFEAMNMDLIAGLPGEDIGIFTRSLQDVAALAPENITVHTLAIKRASKFGIEHTGQFASPEEAEAMIAVSHELLEEKGYLPYYMYRQKHMAGNMENTGYSRPRKECVYNIDIMEEQVSILALGAGAVSKRVFGGQNRIERVMGLKDIAQYVARVEEMIAKKQRLFQEN